MREYEVSRKTGETDISLKLNLDGSGIAEINSGVGFMDHMLTLLTVHGKFDLTLSCSGDTYVDDHHSVEDIGIALGEAFNKAIGDKKGIKRYADIILPMDESLVLCAVDISGRSYLNYDFSIPTQKVGNFDTELVEEFFNAFCRNANITLHIKQLYGTNSHHIIEAAFKAFARCLSNASSIDEKNPNSIPSSKGVL